MGLRKHVTLPNGVQLDYHRVVSVNIVTNQQNIIEVAGYTSQAKRREEQACMRALAEGLPAECDAYIDTQYVAAPYDPGMTVAGAYAWLKGAEEVGGAPNPLYGAEDAMEQEGE